MINLVFYCFPKKEAVNDFRRVRELIHTQAPDIRVTVLSTASALTPLYTAALSLRPTLTIEMDRIKWLRPLRGGHMKHQGMGKIKQLADLEAAGLPVPRWTEILPDTQLDPREWGSYVVVKPSRGVRGAFVRITKTSRVRYTDPAELPDGHPGRRGPMIAQKFVYTGQWPVAYRVLTYLGRPLAAIQYEGRNDLRPLQGEEDFKQAGGSSIVASAMGCTISCVHDEAILDLAVRAHAVFPTIPSLGVDILRDSEGRLHLIEINPSGNSWMLCGKAGTAVQHQFGLDFYAQYGALQIIADASVAAARRLAR